MEAQHPTEPTVPDKYGGGGYAVDSPFQRPEVSNSIKELLDTNPMIAKIKILLLRLETNDKGEWVRKQKKVWIKEKNEFIEVDVEPLVNDEGLDMMLFHFLLFLTSFF